MRNALKVLLVVALAIPSLASATIANTKHNLSATGTGIHFTDTAADMCKFCHLVHNASASATALWGRVTPTTGAVFTGNTVAGTPLPTTKAGLGDGSLKCLSCHDGTVAMNTVVNALGVTQVVAAANTVVLGTSTGNTLTTGSNVYLNGGLGYFANLSGQHPVGIPFPGVTGSAAAANEYAGITNTCAAGVTVCTTSANGGSSIKLYGTTTTARVECGSCHEAHKENLGANPYFLRVATTIANGRCGSCHSK